MKLKIVHFYVFILLAAHLSSSASDLLHMFYSDHLMN